MGKKTKRRTERASAAFTAQSAEQSKVALEEGGTSPDSSNLVAMVERHPGEKSHQWIDRLRKATKNFWLRHGPGFTTTWLSLDPETRKHMLETICPTMPRFPGDCNGGGQEGSSEGATLLLPELDLKTLCVDAPERLPTLFEWWAMAQPSEADVADAALVKQRMREGGYQERHNSASASEIVILVGETRGNIFKITSKANRQQRAQLQAFVDRGLAATAAVEEKLRARQHLVLSLLMSLGDEFRDEILGGKHGGNKTVRQATGCFACGKSGEKLKRCSRCGWAQYCSRECQAEHWKAHKPACKKMVAAAAGKVKPAASSSGGSREARKETAAAASKKKDATHAASRVVWELDSERESLLVAACAALQKVGDVEKVAAVKDMSPRVGFIYSPCMAISYSPSLAGATPAVLRCPSKLIMDFHNMDALTSSTRMISDVLQGCDEAERRRLHPKTASSSMHSAVRSWVPPEGDMCWVASITIPNLIKYLPLRDGSLDAYRFCASQKAHYRCTTGVPGLLSHVLAISLMVECAVKNLREQLASLPAHASGRALRAIHWRGEVVLFGPNKTSVLSGLVKAKQLLTNLGFVLSSPARGPCMWRHTQTLFSRATEDDAAFVKRTLLACYRKRVDDEYDWCGGLRRGLYLEAGAEDASADLSAFLATSEEKGGLPTWWSAEHATELAGKSRSLKFAWHDSEWKEGPLLWLRLLADDLAGCVAVHEW